MFVERSAARMRLVRITFVAACLLPTAGLMGWAAYRRTGGHAAALLDGWTHTLGVRVAAASVEHVRPAMLRLQDVALAGPDGGPLLMAATAEVELRPDGPFVRVPQVELDARSVAACSSLAGTWLTEPVRFRQGVVIDIGRVVWRIGETRVDWGGLRLECVMADGGRAVRIRREPADGDELRVRWEPTDAEPTLTFDLLCQQGLPVGIAAAATGWAPPLGDQATVRVQCSARRERGRWHGEGSGLVEQVDLSLLAAAIDQQAAGQAQLRIQRGIIEDDRIAEARCTLTSQDGQLGRGLIDRMITVLGCQLGPDLSAMQDRSLAVRDGTVRFDQLQLAVDVGPQGILLAPPNGSEAALVSVGGRPLLWAAAHAVPVERLAWLFVPADAGDGPVMIPASPRAMRVLSRLPLPGGSPHGRF